MLRHSTNPGRPAAEDGYRLWLRYSTIEDPELHATYRRYLGTVRLDASGATADAIRLELELAAESLVGVRPCFGETASISRLVIGTPNQSSVVRQLGLSEHLSGLGSEGFVILERELQGMSCLVVAANHEHGLLYGVFQLLLRMSAEVPVAALPLVTKPRLQ